ncbi:MAG: nucleotidyltransferase [Candidatus Limiplasma sp.]|nr:nucleotidyltransferase [Candidatus Limiplasma sp.]
MSIQTAFNKFHEIIKLDYDVRSELKEKRDLLVSILTNSGRLPGFSIINQGSYSMYIGSEPVEGREYDIDVGLKFSASTSDFTPMELKNIIHDILKDHTEYGADIKKPCVTITYKKDGEASYHIDLVVYTYEDKDNHDSQIYLAHGKDSTPEQIFWEKSDPKGLVDYINNAVAVEHRDQYRRIIRYFKRWKNVKFDCDGHAEPPSIGITLIAADYFIEYSVGDGYDDLNAFLALAKNMKNLFTYSSISDNGRYLYRIVYPMPNTLSFGNDTDAFKKMTDSQMTDFKDKLEKLIRDIEAVKTEVDEVEQCRKLSRIFGDDFPVPEAKDVSKKQKNYIPSSSASGYIL